MGIERVIDNTVHEDDSEEEVYEQSLRPTNFSEYIGQERLKKNLKLAIDAVKKRDDGTTLDHVLLYGPPGLGKTTMANVIAHELGANLKVTTGPAIERAGDLASILTNLQEGDVLFIDEIHRLRRAVEEILYSAMEDYKLDIVVGKGPAANSIRLDLPHFTVIGATTRTGSLAGPLRDRFGITHRLEYYKEPEIKQIIKRTAGLLETPIKDDAAEMLVKGDAQGGDAAGTIDQNHVRFRVGQSCLRSRADVRDMVQLCAVREDSGVLKLYLNGQLDSGLLPPGEPHEISLAPPSCADPARTKLYCRPLAFDEV